MKKCPFCAEEIQDAAIKCRYCGSQLNVPPDAATSSPAVPEPTAAPAKRFQNVTESDVRLLADGAVIDLQAGGRITPRVEELLAAKHVTVLRSSPAVKDDFDDVRELVRQGQKIAAIKALRDKTGWDLKKAKDFVESPEGGALPPSDKSAWQKPVGRKKSLALLAVGIGFILTAMSSATAGLGVFILWGGLAYTISGGAVARWGGGLLLTLILGGMGIATFRTTTPSTSTPASTRTTAAVPASRTTLTPSRPPEPTYQLELISSRGYESDGGGYHIVEGQVKNVSDQPLKSVMAVATWLDDKSGFITSDDALIDYNPILPGQTSPFKTMSRTNPAMSKYRVEFKILFGGTLRVDDKRSK